MNLFYLDDDLDKCAEYHIDPHVGKMQLEAAQLLTTTVWIDKHLGFIPRKLTSEELGVINDFKSREPHIDSRTFTRYLPTHINHPSAIWVRSSLEHYYWTVNYVNALNAETMYRGNKSHASCAEVNRMPEPTRLPDKGWVPPTLAMPDKLKSSDHIASYRMFYMLDKWPFASWKVRGKPHWWDDNIVEQQKLEGGRVSGR
jgi:hypothetical protein